MPTKKPEPPKSKPAKGQQPEALATFAASAKSGEGKKPDPVGLTATAKTAPLPADPKKKAAVATELLNKGAKGEPPDPKPAVDALPDRTRAAKKKG